MRLTADTFTTISTNTPRLAVITNLTLNVGEPFSLSNGLVRFVEGHSYAFALDPGAIELGAQINPTNGMLSWTPKCHQARSTNSFTVWVTDDTWTNLLIVVGPGQLSQVKRFRNSGPGTNGIMARFSPLKSGARNPGASGTPPSASPRRGASRASCRLGCSFGCSVPLVALRVLCSRRDGLQERTRSVAWNRFGRQSGTAVRMGRRWTSRSSAFDSRPGAACAI